jgi:hypothetical protein
MRDIGTWPADTFRQEHSPVLSRDAEPPARVRNPSRDGVNEFLLWPEQDVSLYRNSLTSSRARLSVS